jgi:hypothetical protein
MLTAIQVSRVAKYWETPFPSMREVLLHISEYATHRDLAQPASTWLEFPFAKTILSTVGGTATMKLNYVIEACGCQSRRKRK